MLASVHLLEFDSEDVLRLPDLIHAYARELVTTEDTIEQRTAAAQRLVSWYVATVHEATRHLAPHSMVSVKLLSLVDGVEPLHFTDDLDAWTWCDTEKTNFEPITIMALQHGPQHAAHHLASELDVVGLLDHAHQRRDREPDSSDVTRRGFTDQDPPWTRHENDQPPYAGAFACANWIKPPGFGHALSWRRARKMHSAEESPCHLDRSWTEHGLAEFVEQTPVVSASNEGRTETVTDPQPEPPWANSRHDDPAVPSQRLPSEASQHHVPDTAA
jgi:hypothetical protein